MVRELLIELYLMVVKIVFSIFNLLPIKNKVTFVVSFGDNVQCVYEEIRRKNIRCEAVFLCKGQNINKFLNYEDTTALSMDGKNPIDFIRSLYHLATSRYILVDNYYGFLAVTEFKEDVTCVQLWHASGAIKKFGLEDASVKTRTGRAKQRFMKVYSRFNKVVVGSDIMANHFMNAFNLKGENILRTGIPRTDFFYDSALKESVFHQLEQENELLWNKKVILYAPTYRDNELDSFKLQLSLDKMKEQLGDNYIVVLRLHPAIRKDTDYSEKYPGFVLDYSSSKYDINRLLLISDYLITDYSSVIYEYALLKKPIILFAYDLEDYTANRGLWDQYENAVPGPVVRTTEDIIQLIKDDQFDMKKIEEFSQKWNKYSKGNSSANLISYLFDESSYYSKQRAL